jgi:hypothetical protein
VSPVGILEVHVGTQAVKLIPRPFEGNPKQLREFIEGTEAAIEVTHPGKQKLLLKYIVAKIQGAMLKISC